MTELQASNAFNHDVSASPAVSKPTSLRSTRSSSRPARDVVAESHRPQGRNPRQAASTLEGIERTILGAATDARRTQAEAQRQEILATLAGGIAHECNSVLLAASTYLCGVHSSPGGSDPFIAKAAALIQQAQTLSASLLELFAVPETAGACVLSVGGWLPACIGQLSGMLPPKVSVHLLPVDGPLDARIDSLTLEQVLRVLITNAAEALGNDGEVTIAAAHRGPRIEIRVSDRGSGIAPADRDRVFEPLFSTRKRSRRSGLGLAIASRLVTQTGGSLTYEPNEPCGSTFVIRLRAAQEEAE